MIVIQISLLVLFQIIVLRVSLIALLCTAFTSLLILQAFIDNDIGVSLSCSRLRSHVDACVGVCSGWSHVSIQS